MCMIAATTFYIQAFVNHGNQYNKWKETTDKITKKIYFSIRISKICAIEKSLQFA
jgi:hypothetical protein